MRKMVSMNSIKKCSVGSFALMAVLCAANVQAAVSLVGTSKAAKGSSGTMTVTAPSSTTAGDVMVLFLGASDTTPLTSLSGWTQIMTKGPDDINLTSFYRVYKSGDSKTINVTVRKNSFATLFVLRGADASNPIVDKDALKDLGGSDAPKGRSHAPSINSASGGMLLCGFMWDDPYKNCTVSKMKVAYSFSNGDDGLTSAYQSTSGGSTGERVAVAPAVIDGGGNEIGMSISVRP